MKKLRRKKVYEDVLYANCWEDPAIDRKAFCINSDDIVFSITSGGCNILTFLLDDPKKVIAMDLNPHQNYLLELKMAAFKKLNYQELLCFMGVHVSEKREELYANLKSELSTDCMLFWDNHKEYIRMGIIHCGRFEKYMRLLGKTVNLIFSRNLIERLYNEIDKGKREIIFTDEWNGISWNIFKRVLLSRYTMSFLFDKAFFKYLEENFSFGSHFENKMKYAFTQLPIKENYFLAYILNGKYYNDEHLPQYLKRENYEHIRSNIDRIEIVTDSCQNYFQSLPDNYISKFNFSNIFEWISADDFESLLKDTIKIAKNNAIITYRNLLVHRESPQSLKKNITSHKELATSLHKEDLSFIYNNYVVEQIHKD